MKKPIPPEERCCEMVSGTGPWGCFHRHQCERRGVLAADGKRYCKQHHPDTIKANHERWRREGEAHSLDSRPSDRSDKLLVQVIEELKEKANGSCAELQIVEIPDGIEWEIEEYDGQEWISEKHRTW